jgi:hypothetical protein
MSAEDATWEPLQEFQDLYPDFHLEDEPGRDVMIGV